MADSKRGLDALTGVLLKACGDLVAGSKRGPESITIQTRLSHSTEMKAAMRHYVKIYNAKHGTRTKVSFPKPFQITVQEPKRSAR